MTRARWLGLLCLSLAGCVSVGNARLADDQTMAQITVGETTAQQVAILLGDPDGKRAIESGGAARQWWSYSYASAVINPIEYLLLYGLFFNGIGLYDTRYDIDIFFDHREVVSSFSRLKTDYDMGAPFVPAHIASVSSRTMGFTEPSKEPVHFEDRFDYRNSARE